MGRIAFGLGQNRKLFEPLIEKKIGKRSQENGTSSTILSIVAFCKSPLDLLNRLLKLNQVKMNY